jgi:hypothetical protein
MFNLDLVQFSQMRALAGFGQHPTAIAFTPIMPHQSDLGVTRS